MTKLTGSKLTLNFELVITVLHESLIVILNENQWNWMTHYSLLIRLVIILITYYYKLVILQLIPRPQSWLGLVL